MIQKLSNKKIDENEFEKYFSSCTEEERKVFLANKTEEVSGNLHMCLDHNGNRYLLLRKFNNDTINATIDHLSDYPKIVFHNLPKEHRENAEIASLKRWKKVSFDNFSKGKPGETLLSKALPDKPRDFGQWVKNIHEKSYGGLGDQRRILRESLITLVKRVVSNDTDDLFKLWSDLCTINKNELNGYFENVYKRMDKDQKTALIKHLIELEPDLPRRNKQSKELAELKKYLKKKKDKELTDFVASIKKAKKQKEKVPTLRPNV